MPADKLWRNCAPRLMEILRCGLSGKATRPAGKASRRRLHHSRAAGAAGTCDVAREGCPAARDLLPKSRRPRPKKRAIGSGSSTSWRAADDVCSGSCRGGGQPPAVDVAGHSVAGRRRRPQSAVARRRHLPWALGNPSQPSQISCIHLLHVLESTGELADGFLGGGTDVPEVADEIKLHAAQAGAAQLTAALTSKKYLISTPSPER